MSHKMRWNKIRKPNGIQIIETELEYRKGLSSEERATDPQKSFMKRLGIIFPHFVSKKEASLFIKHKLDLNKEIQREAFKNRFQRNKR